MPTSLEVKKGMRILLDGDPYNVLETTVQTPSARGGATLVKLKAKNIRTGQFVQKSFKAGDKIQEANFEIVPCQYLYNENREHFIFMNNESYEQFSIPFEEIEEELGYIRENDMVRVLLHDAKPIGVEVPSTVILEVTDCEPAIKGDTVTSVTKAATMETGIVIQVPLFIERGTKLVIDTRDGRYIKRA